MADAKKYLDLQGLTTYDGKIKGYVNEKESALDAKITAEKNRAEGVEGTLTSLTTDAKDNLVAAINEVDSNANAAAAAAKTAQNDVDALETLVGEIPAGATATTVVGYAKEVADAATGSASQVAEDLAAEITRAKAAEKAAQDAANAAQSDVDALEGLVGTLPEGAIAKTVTGYIDEAAGKVAADLTALDGSLKAVAKSGAAADVSIADEGGKITATTVEGALAELAEAISTISTAGAVTCEKSSPNGVAARYIFKQGGVEIPNAVVDIPKDMVVESGEVVTNPEGQPAGTYIVLTLANKAENKLYINVTDLIEYVTGGETDEIAVAVSAEHVATATVKKITATKIIYKPSVGEAPEVSVAAALNDIYTQIGKGGSVAGQISAAIAGLDATVNQVGTGENGTGLTLQVIETDGTLTAVAGSINTITGEDINKLFETTTV